MRFLHTSDWHLGRSLHRADLRQAQSRFLDHLVETARSERVDAVLIAGDVYDRAIPPVDAVAMFEDALARLRAAGARVILISGNHDSARRLGVNSALIDAAGVHLRTRPQALADPVLLSDSHGQVAVYGLPYLEPALGLPDLADAPFTHEAVLGEAVRRVRADAAARAARRTVVLAHAWVAGGGSDAERRQDAEGARSASERDISVGGIGYVPAELFDGFSYAALGHLHGRRTLAGHLRYSGSPLPYSFSEASQVKGSWLVEVGGDGTARADWVPAPVHRRLATLSGHLDDLLTAPGHEEHAADFLAVTLTDIARPAGAMDRLRARFPHILTLEFKPEGAVEGPHGYREKVRGRDDPAVAAEFVKHVRGTDADDGERALLAAAFAAARDGGQP
jgi:DNA repair protein SbcD/Mre11